MLAAAVAAAAGRAEDSLGLEEVEDVLEVAVGVDVNVGVGTESGSVGVMLACKRGAVVVVTRPSAGTTARFSLMPDTEMILERKVPASLLILKAQP